MHGQSLSFYLPLQKWCCALSFPDDYQQPLNPCQAPPGNNLVGTSVPVQQLKGFESYPTAARAKLLGIFTIPNGSSRPRTRSSADSLRSFATFQIIPSGERERRRLMCRCTKSLCNRDAMGKLDVSNDATAGQRRNGCLYPGVYSFFQTWPHRQVTVILSSSFSLSSSPPQASSAYMVAAPHPSLPPSRPTHPPFSSSVLLLPSISHLPSASPQEASSQQEIHPDRSAT
jgi:hypothetical protein